MSIENNFKKSLHNLKELSQKGINGKKSGILSHKDYSFEDYQDLNLKLEANIELLFRIWEKKRGQLLVQNNKDIEIMMDKIPTIRYELENNKDINELKNIYKKIRSLVSQVL